MRHKTRNSRHRTRDPHSPPSLARCFLGTQQGIEFRKSKREKKPKSEESRARTYYKQQEHSQREREEER